MILQRAHDEPESGADQSFTFLSVPDVASTKAGVPPGRKRLPETIHQGEGIKGMGEYLLGQEIAYLGIYE